MRDTFGKEEKGCYYEEQRQEYTEQKLHWIPVILLKSKRLRKRGRLYSESETDFLKKNTEANY